MLFHHLQSRKRARLYEIKSLPSNGYDIELLAGEFFHNVYMHYIYYNFHCQLYTHKAEKQI